MKARDVEAFLIFLVIQPLLFFFGIGIFLHGVYQAIWG
jgi:hypothetical protein